jgi:hypothetical protein
MAEFVRAQIFGTTFEITSRYGQLKRFARVRENGVDSEDGRKQE